MTDPSAAAPAAAGARLLRNPARLCAFRALQMCLFPMAVLTIFYRDVIAMSMRDIFLLQGAFGLAMLLVELPTGYLADRIGYRRTLLLAALVMAVGWAVYGSADRLASIVVAELVLGVAMGLISGADTALLYESLLESGREGDFAAWDGRVRFWGQIGEATGAVASGALYAVSVRLPFYLEVGAWAAAALVAARLVEPSRHRPALTGNLAQVRALLAHVRRTPPLPAVIFTTIALSMSSFIPVWSIQVHARNAGVPEAWLGPIWAAANVIVALAALASHRVRQRLGLHALLLLCVLLVAAGYAGLGLVHAPWGFAAYFLLTAMRGLHGPALHHEEHRLVGSRDRAGLISLRSLLFRGTYCILGPAAGHLMDRHGHHPVYLGLGALLAVSALSGTAALARHRRSAPGAEPVD